MKGFIFFILLALSTNCFASPSAKESGSDSTNYSNGADISLIGNTDQSFNESIDALLVRMNLFNTFFSLYGVDPLVTNFKGIPIDGTPIEFTRKLLSIGFVDIPRPLSEDRHLFGSMFNHPITITLLANPNNKVYFVNAHIRVESDLDAINLMNQICGEFYFSTDYYPKTKCSFYSDNNPKEAINKMTTKPFTYIQIMNAEEEELITKRIKTGLIKRMPLYQDADSTINFLTKCFVNFYKAYLMSHRIIHVASKQDSSGIVFSIGYVNFINFPNYKDF